MLKKERAIYIINKLEEIYPETPIPLDSKTKFQLLIAVLLSAQCTDKRVNKITPKLFTLGPDALKMSKLSLDIIYKIIRPCGLAPQKSKAILGLSKILIKKYEGEVPEDIMLLEQLPGVGHKTASVVMSQGFGHPAFPIDTHVHRLAQRWGLTKGKNVKETERDLKNIFPKSLWNKLHLQIIFYGREFCTARGCNGINCEICKTCYPNRVKPFNAIKP
jgi:endonuclease-3